LSLSSFFSCPPSSSSFPRLLFSPVLHPRPLFHTVLFSPFSFFSCPLSSSSFPRLLSCLLLSYLLVLFSSSLSSPVLPPRPLFLIFFLLIIFHYQPFFTFLSFSHIPIIYFLPLTPDFYSFLFFLHFSYIHFFLSSPSCCLHLFPSLACSFSSFYLTTPPFAIFSLVIIFLSSDFPVFITFFLHRFHHFFKLTLPTPRLNC
jgi:hypothetical protein